MKFYVYELVVIPDGAVCYVGKGSGKRMFKHRANLKVTRYAGVGLYRRLRDLLNSGKDFKPRKVFETDDEQAALVEEKRRIELYGFENLFNSTTRQGLTVASIDEAHRQALSKARREYVNKLQVETGRKMPAAVAAKISAANRNRVLPPDFGDKISAAKKGKPLTDEHRQALTGVPKVFSNEEAKVQRNLKAGAAIKQAWDEGRLTGSRGQHITFKNPEERGRKISEAKRGRTVPQVVRDKIAATLRGKTPVFSDPEGRLQKISASLKKAWVEGRCKASAVAVEAMRKSNTGKQRSVETRKLLSEKRRQRVPRVYLVTAPDGIVTRQDSYSLQGYCLQRGISPSNLLRGKSKGYYLDRCPHVPEFPTGEEAKTVLMSLPSIEESITDLSWLKTVPCTGQSVHVAPSFVSTRFEANSI